MQLITLTTDWGYKDFFVGAVKAKLYTGIGDVQVVDITHGIKPYNLHDAVFVVKNACLNYPKGTIHIIDIDSCETIENPHVVILYKEQYFICTDNGLPYLVFGDSYSEVVAVEIIQDSDFFTFIALDLFAKIAILIARGTPLNEMGTKRIGLYQRILPQPNISNNEITAKVQYVDHYGNAYLNISYREFIEARKNRPFTIKIGKDGYIHEVNTSYQDKSDSELVLTVSSSGVMQIANSKASAEQLVGLKMGTIVNITFG